jgi:methylthioribose-1-phosphate isomerase
MPRTLITDSMAGFLMKRNPIDVVIVGADRIARNGDTANKIGTYQLALLAKAHGVKMVVAAPATTVDLSLTNGGQIPIEERAATELTSVTGALLSNLSEQVTVQIAPVDMPVWNPGFECVDIFLLTKKNTI